ncbi:unnamed protein product [Boreogadus saida]
MDEEREEEGPTTKTTLSGEHGRRSKAKSPEQQRRADSPGPSSVSRKSDWLMERINCFEPKRVQQQRADSPGPSCVSMKSDHSMNIPPKDGNQSIEMRRVQQQRADSPGPSCVSMKSDRSRNRPPVLKDGRLSREERQHQERSKVTSAQSEQQHQTELIKRAEENAPAFQDKEMKKHRRYQASEDPQCSESQREEEKEEDGKNEEQRRRAIEGVVDITKLCLTEMNQEELADTPWGRVLERIRSKFVEKVTDPVIKGLLDDLWQQKVFNTEEKDSVMEGQTIRADQARCLIDMVIRKGEKASQAMIDSMKKRDGHLCSTLGLMSSPAGVGRDLSDE